MDGNPAFITMSPLFIGLMFNILLYGIFVAQVHVYYNTYRKDKWWLKSLVAFILAADTAQTLFLVAYLYDNLLINFNNPQYLATTTLALNTDPVLTGIISATVQCYFAYRVRVMTGKLWIALVIVGFSAITFLSSLATSIAAGILPSFAEWGRFQSAVILWLLSSSIADVLITSTLVYTLRKRKTGFKTTDSVVDRIIRLTVQTGLITAVVAVINTIIFMLFPSGLHLVLNAPLCKLYSNSLLSSLNSRGSLRKEANNSSSGPSTAGAISIDMPHKPHVVQLGAAHEPRVFVQVETDMEYDMPERGINKVHDPEDPHVQRMHAQKSYIDMPYDGSGPRQF